MTNKYIAERRAQRARQIQRRNERRARKRRNILFTSITAVLVIAVVAGFAVVGINMAGNNSTYISRSPAAAVKLTPADASNDFDAAVIAVNQEAASFAASAQTSGGSPLHFYATGKTSYGYNWDYGTDNNIINVSCNYDFSSNRYDLILTGTHEGVAHVTLYYFTDDNTKVPVEMTVNVDANLNVTQI